jgi:tripartite-type tricarboxylate transporter receptor subunit TctC
MLAALRLAGAMIAAAAFALASALPASAQNYPSRPITVVVPLAAGTGMDTIARLYAEKLSANLGQPVVVDNRPGASLTLGTTSVAKAAPDGYTLLIGSTSGMAISPVLMQKLAYDVDRDFTAVAFYVKSPFVLIVNPGLPIRTVPEFISYAKQANPPLTYSSPGHGVAQHLAMEFLKQKFGLQMTHVPYRNTGQSITDIAAGHVSAGFAETGASVPLIRDGQLRALAVSSSTRLPSLPDVPPLAEAAGTSDLEAVSWHILVAPAKTPPAVLDVLNAQMQRVLGDPEIQQKIVKLGLIPVDPPSREGSQAYLASERAKWGALVRQLGLEGSQ